MHGQAKSVRLAPPSPPHHPSRPARSWMVRELAGRTALYQRDRPMTEADLLLAQRRLHLFSAVLLLEQPATSMALLQAMFGWRDTAWEEHRAGSRAGSDAAAELSPAVLDELQRRHVLDVRLYAYAEVLHAQHVRQWLRDGRTRDAGGLA